MTKEYKLEIISKEAIVSTLNNYPDIYLDPLRKITKVSVAVICLQTKMRIRDLWNIKQKLYLLQRSVR
jgi:hypothetical protein